MGGEGRKSMDPAARAGGAALNDRARHRPGRRAGSAVIGMTLLEGGVSVAVLVAVFLSNLPEAFAATANREGAGAGSSGSGPRSP